MRGTGKFLFAGLLGAALVFLVSPKRGQMIRDALLGRRSVESGSEEGSFPRAIPRPPQEISEGVPQEISEGVLQEAAEVSPDIIIEEPEPVEAVRPEGETGAEESVGEDLKARIEETRRKIQEELEQPFAPHEEGGSVAEEPVVEEPVAEGPLVEEEPAVEEEPEEMLGAGEEGPAVSTIPSTADEDGASFDQEAMRNRIEETRNRLKAKVFDAMMSGEEALISRGEGQKGEDDDDSPSPGGADERAWDASLDEEVDESIESRLKESDDL